MKKVYHADEELAKLVKSQAFEIKKHIQDVEEHLAEGRLAKAFSSLRLTAHTDDMKVFGARMLNDISKEILNIDEEYEAFADNWHIVFETDKYQLKFPIIDKVYEIRVVNKRAEEARFEMHEFTHYGQHAENVDMLEKLDNYNNDNSLEKLNEYLKAAGYKEISLVTFRMSKNKHEQYGHLVSTEQLKSLQELVDKGNSAIEYYREVEKDERAKVELAKEHLADFIKIGYIIKVFK